MTERHIAVLARVQTRGEELANSLSHGLGLGLAIAAIPVMVVLASRGGGALEVAALSIFGASMVLCYGSSTLYHALPEGTGKRIAQALDHAAIFLLIAGTYTPFTLAVIGGAWGWSLFGVVWGLALVGMVLKFAAPRFYRRISTAVYLGMGWLVIIALRPMWLALSGEAIGWLAAGGLFYTAGVAFYVSDHKPYHHFVWHLFVLGGTVCHVVALMSCLA